MKGDGIPLTPASFHSYRVKAWLPDYWLDLRCDSVRTTKDWMAATE